MAAAQAPGMRGAGGMGGVDVHVVAALGAGGTPVGSRAKPQDILFLYSPDVPGTRGMLAYRPYHYRPYHYGPYSRGVQDSIERLLGIGVAVHADGLSLAGRGGPPYDEASGKVGGGNMRVCESKDLINCMDDREAPAYTYSRYPEMAERSPIYDDIMGDL